MCIRYVGRTIHFNRMNDREEIVYILHTLIVEGYSKGELTRMIKSDYFSWGSTKWPTSKIDGLINEARRLCTIEEEDNTILYERLLSIYRGSMKKEDYSNALKAVKELKEFSKGNNNQEITVKLIKE